MYDTTLIHSMETNLRRHAVRDVLRVQPEVILEGPLQTIRNLRDDGEELHDDDADVVQLGRHREVDEEVQRLKP